MEQTAIKNQYRFVFLGSFFLFFLSLINVPVAKADNASQATPNNQLVGTQLAYFHGGYRGGFRGGYRGWRGGYRGWRGGYRGWRWNRGYYGGYYNPAYYAAPAVAVYGASSNYWTGWKYIGQGCSRNCLVNRMNGRVIRCSKRCR